MAFETYAEAVLGPPLRPGDVVIMDDLGSHKRSPPIEAAGARVRFLQAYSLDLNPIEKMLSELKAYLRKAKARAVLSLWDALGDGLHTVAGSDIAG